MKLLLTSFIIVLASSAQAGFVMPDNPPNPPVYASAADYAAMKSASNYDRVDQLCPQSIQEYGEAMDFDETVIEAFKDHFFLKQIAENHRRHLLEHELCMELKTLKRDYDLLLSTSVMGTEENKQKVRVGLDELHTCLANAKKRSEIERCDNNFRFLITTLLDL